METKVCCPDCKHEFTIEIDELIASNVEKDVKAKLESDYRKKLKAIEKTEFEMEEMKKKVTTIEEDALMKAMKTLSEKEEEIKRDAEVRSSQKAALDLDEEKRKLKAKEDDIEITVRRRTIEASDKVRDEEKLKQAELQKKMDDQKKLIEEMQRKAEQGSNQLQGEIQELELEKMLRVTHPYDEITEIKKGQKGADILQEVRTSRGTACGKIYYESKRTIHYDEKWIQKLKEDNLEVKADVLVIATEAMPEGETRFFLQEDVWICSFREAKALSMVLRHGLIQLQGNRMTLDGKATKMEQLYHYLTSAEFNAQFGAILDGFRDLEDGYRDEKLRMQKIWKQREKHLEKILSNAAFFYGSLKGIGGSAIVNIEALELSKGD